MSNQVIVNTAEGYVAGLDGKVVRKTPDKKLAKPFRNRHEAGQFIARHGDKGRGIDRSNVQVLPVDD